ncbi:hypothetical protein NDA14_003454 [Ustilago hordei]|nr:hypothetical protein NDA14_003454 [Ustilago hordei]
MEPAPASSATSPSAETSSATSKSHSAPPPKDPFPEVLDWAAEVEIAEAKKARNEARKTERKDKAAQKKQAKLAQLDADRLAGKPPPRGCVRCKTRHWEQDPCPPKPTASPEKEASKIKSSGAGKRKHTGAEVENSGGPSKKGKGRVSNVDLGKGVIIRAVAGRSSSRKTTSEFQDGTHCYLNLSKFSNDWQKGKTLEKGFSVVELTRGMRAAGLVPIRASNQSGASTLEWLIRFGSSSDAEEAVDKPFHLRGVEVRLTPLF